MRAWTFLTLLLVAAVSAVNLAGTVRRNPPPPRLPPEIPANVVLRQEQRLAGLLLELKARGVRGTLGYLADLPPEQLRADPAAMERYFLPQFALAPWILDATTQEAAWIVADLRVRPAAERIPAGCTVERDFGDGVLLLRRRAP